MLFAILLRYARCLDTLANTTELFAVRFDAVDETGESGHVQAQFYDLYANKRAKPRHAGGANTGTGCLTAASTTGAHPPGDRPSGSRVNFTLPSQDGSLASFLDASDPTVRLLASVNKLETYHFK